MTGLAAMKIDTYEEMSQVNTYVLLPMSFLCGTFFSPAVLPKVVGQFIELLPLTHTSMLLRSLTAGAEVSLTSVAVLLVYGFVLLFWDVRAFLQLSGRE